MTHDKTFVFVIPDCESPVAFKFAFTFIETQIMHSFTQIKFIIFKKNKKQKTKYMIHLKSDVAVNI